MNESITIYRAKGKEIGLVFLFKYDLQGNLKLFEIAEGELNEQQIKWLFSSHFPSSEIVMKTVWMKDKKYLKAFDIQKSAANLSFDALWDLYANKVSKWDAEKAFNKLNEANKIKCFLAVPGYKKYLAQKQTGIAHLSTFINKQYYNDDWNKA